MNNLNERNKFYITLVCFYLFIILTAYCGSSEKSKTNDSARGEGMVFPGSDWEIKTPESQGVNSKKLNEAMEYLGANAGGSGVSEAVVIRNGYMIWKGTDIDNRHAVHSVTKTFTTTVLGLLIDDGKLALDDFAVNYMPSLDDTYPTYAKIKFRHFASMTSGYNSIKGDQTDPRTYLIPGPPLFEPGRSFKYHDPAVHMLGYILNRISGESLGSTFKRRIADPIGMSNWDWSDYGDRDGIVFNNPAGTPGDGQGGISITARDLARFGLLYLSRGKWKAQQLISSDWIDQATINQVPVSIPTKYFDLRGRYGFMWWTNGKKADRDRPWPSAPPKTYTAYGASRNFCFVIPEWKMVIVRMDDSVRMPLSTENKIWDNFFKILRKGISGASKESVVPVITGELKVWHPLTICFRGPALSESHKNPNPFLDYRLQVIFTGPNAKSYNVPGFFDGDGTGGGTGDVWKVHFTPDEAGRWNYQVSFRHGKDIAVKTGQAEGVPLGFDGVRGTFNIAKGDKSSPGFLGRGRLSYVGGFYLKTLGDGRYWIKGGTDSPENFLAYYGFDGTLAGPSGIHTYSTYRGDWNSGDPDWDDGRGKGIIGALNYLSSKKVNSIYFLLMNIGGDGQDTWPYLGSINPRGSVENDNKHFDISKLAQWEMVFAHAQRKGISLNVVLAEGERMNKQEMDNASLGVERKLYYREMVARFGHHNALQWMLCEEYDHKELALNPTVIKSWAHYIREIDPCGHPVSVHNMSESGWDPFFGDALFDITSYQYHGKGMDGVRYSAKVESLRQRALSAGRKIAISIDEPVTTSMFDNEEDTVINHGRWRKHIYGQSYIRKNVIYPIYFSGGSVELILQDCLKIEDFRQYDRLWNYLYYARRFIEDNLPFWEMEPMDRLLTGESEEGQVFAKSGEVYAIYLPKADRISQLVLYDIPYTFEMQWYNPRTGEFEGSPITKKGNDIIYLGSPPRDPLQDWVILLKRK